MSWFFFFSSRRRHTRYWRDWSSDVCSSDLWQYQRKQSAGISILISAETNFMNKKLLIALAFTTLLSLGAKAQKLMVLSDNHSILRMDVSKKYVLLPVEEREEIAHVRVLKDGKAVEEFNCRLATDHVDYYVPLDVEGLGNNLLLDITFAGNRRSTGAINDFAVWKQLKTADTFDTTNRERFRPAYHHTPLYGWMNDPNGMFYKDGTWHLYFQYNPYGSMWENMNWAHSTSKDLIHWQYEGKAIEPDALGTVFSGSAVVDHNNTAGLDRKSVV